MSCTKPLLGYWSLDKNEYGNRYLVFDKKRGVLSQAPVFVPCGGCISCRVDRARQWAVRCMHEKQFHHASWFVTLTYRPETLPPGGSLDKNAIPLFMRKLRKARETRDKDGKIVRAQISYFACGEYGEQLLRPHYHLILFGVDFPDRSRWKQGPQGTLYRSPELEKLWPHGFSSIGAVTFESCAYVARYVMKKITGDKAESHYNGLQPELLRMSLNPAIGKRWFDKYKTDVYPSDFTVVSGKKTLVPKYYDKKLSEIEEALFMEVKTARKRRGSTPEKLREFSPVRLAVKNEVKTAAHALLKRDLEQ